MSENRRAPVAIDAMGGDRAPGEIVAGAIGARDELGADILLVGRPDELGDTDGIEVLEASEVVPMDADPAKAVRTLKDSSLVRAAEAVRDGRACAMVSAGNTGATMGAALLRIKRLPGVARPAIATPIPRPGSDVPMVLLDAGANAECSPEWLVQFAQMGSVYARHRYGIERPRVGLLNIGEEPSKGTPLVRETHELLSTGSWAENGGGDFVGNVEGRDIMSTELDVIVTDGFTGNVVLKTLEGAMKSLISAILGAFDTDDDTRSAGETLFPALLPLYGQLDPDNTGGALLLGLRGPCIISHGSSSATAIVNAVKVAIEMVESDLCGAIGTTIRPA